MNLLSSVNLLQGTRSTRDFSTGNTLPLIARPWGMHHWTLQTSKGPWFFHPDHRKLQGLRLTHQPSPWMGDYGNMVISAFHGPILESLEHQSSAYQLGETQLHPHHIKVELLRYRMTLEMSPTERGAIFAFTRNGTAPIRVRFDFEGKHELSKTSDTSVFTGISRNQHGGVAGDFGLRFAAVFDRVPVHYEEFARGCVFTFAAGVNRVELRLAGSFLSESQALTSLNTELAGRDLVDLAAEGGEIWSALLGRIRLPEPETEQQKIRHRTFYSCLYRCLLFPRILGEIDADGRTFHYSPADGKTYPGSLYADSGFWDTYRTLYPLLAEVYADKLRKMLEGWLNACRESGWSPKWPSPGPRVCMIGTHYDIIVADAIARGITDWNVAEAFEYLWRDATEIPNDAKFGRTGLSDYINLGYVPADKFSHATATTLDYAYDDFCIAKVARFLGKNEEADLLEKRSQNYRHVFDPSVGFMRGRKADGTWLEPFDAFEWGGPFIEGGAWQHTFNVPHDPAGLAELFGGEAGLCRKLDEMLATPAHFSVGSYPQEIHEMTEMALADFGQYAQSNQPVHHFLFLFAAAGQPEKTAHWVHRVADELFSPDDFPGDEDNGEMAAWFVFACLGRFPTCPGTAGFTEFPPFIPGAKVITPAREQ